MKKLRKVFAVALLIGLGGCGFFQEETPDPVTTNGLSYSSREPILLKVSKIDVVSEFTPSFKRPNVEHLFPTSIEKSAKIWARDRLEATEPGSSRIATFIIKDASVVESLDPSQKAFYKDRNKYRANLNVVLKVTDSSNMSRAQTEIQAWRELLIPIDTPLEEKERYWDEMVKKLMDEFDARMTENVYKHLNMFIKDNNTITEY